MEIRYKCGHTHTPLPSLQRFFEDGERGSTDECPRCLAKEFLQGKIKRLRDDVREMIRHATDIEKGVASWEAIGALEKAEAVSHWYKVAETTSRNLACVYDRYWQLLTEEEKSVELKERLKEWAAGNF